MQKVTTPGTSVVAEKDLELTAYIYQQLADIQPYLMADAQLAVSIEHVEEKRKKTKFIVTLTATVEDEQIEIAGQGTDFYQAFAMAKEKMLHQLSDIQNSLMDSAERELIVRSAMTGGLTIH